MIAAASRTTLLGLLLAAALAAGQPPEPEALPRPKPAAEDLPAPKPTRPEPRPTTVGVQLSDRPLDLATVLASAERHFPAIVAAEQERAVAEGRLVSAMGGFDTSLTGSTYLQGGSYASTRGAVGLSQPLPHLGASVFGGYRIGRGNFPDYYGERLTAEGGEFRAGVAVPLLRDRDLDRRRGGINTAMIDRALAEPAIQLQRIDVVRAAARAYWAWVATAQRFHVAAEVLQVARARDAQIAKAIEAGSLEEIARIDNRRIVVERQVRLQQAARAYQAATIVLALYLRNEAGEPVVPDSRDVPAFHELPPLPDEKQRADDLAEALRQRPEPARLALQREKLAIELRLAENQTLPGLNLALSGAQDVGYGKSTLDRATYDAALLLDVPLQRRDARGRILATQAQIGQTLAQEQLARDRVVAEVLDALSALTQAAAVRDHAREGLRLARQVERGERIKFDAGESDLFRVNIRELQRAEAQFQELDALAEFYRALADYQAALGRP